MEIQNRFRETRKFSERLAAPLSPEDCVVQSMEDASPTRWHLAHTTWFFETFILCQQADYTCFDDAFGYLFNSYYNTIGEQFPRAQRGLLSRPGLERIWQYRRHVDQQILERLDQPDFADKFHRLIEIGIQHEQQHQELILTDIKHVLSCNPVWPIYEDLPLQCSGQPAARDPLLIEAGIHEVGHTGDGFAFDNESPRHKSYLHACRIDGRLVTCGEYAEFIDAGGYDRPEMWLSLGWATVQQQGWQAPLYWQRAEGEWKQFTLAGMQPIDEHAPVTHISFFEADAYARWRGKRLPTEFEWEVAAATMPIAEDDQFVDRLIAGGRAIHPTCSPSGLCGAVWQWTSSSYLGYPGYHPPAGAVGEYNGKFMCDQHVLRGGSVATHSQHIRHTYRNFFPAHTRWQFSGIRLAE